VEFVTRYWGGRSSTLGGVPDLPQLRAARELAEPGEPLWVQTIDWTSGSELRGWPWFAVSCKMVVSRPLRTDPEWLNHWTSVTSRTDRKPDRPRQPGAMHSTDRLPLPLPMPADVEGALLIGTRSHPAARRDVGAVVLPYLPIWPGLLADTRPCVSSIRPPAPGDFGRPIGSRGPRPPAPAHPHAPRPRVTQPPLERTALCPVAFCVSPPPPALPPPSPPRPPPSPTRSSFSSPPSATPSAPSCPRLRRRQLLDRHHPAHRAP
jgi:hypothetical protein